MKAMFEISPYFRSIIEIYHADEFITLALCTSNSYDLFDRSIHKIIFELQDNKYVTIDGKLEYMPVYYLYQIKND